MLFESCKQILRWSGVWRFPLIPNRDSHETRVPVIDLLFASSGIEPEVVAMADSLEVFPKLSLPVARVGHLLALKLLARAESRPQDQIDLEALLAVATPEETALAEESIRLIAARGFQRDKNLAEEWAELMGG